MGKTSRACSLKFGANMWKQRNKFYHGNDGSISLLEEEKMHDIIHQVYDNIAPTCLPEHKWMFAKTLDEQLQTQYAHQIAWLDGVRRLYPIQHGEILQTVGNQKVFDQEMEYFKWQTKQHGLGGRELE